MVSTNEISLRLVVNFEYEFGDPRRLVMPLCLEVERLVRTEAQRSPFRIEVEGLVRSERSHDSCPPSFTDGYPEWS